MSYVFISYASKDQDFAIRLVTEIERRGIRCWISCRDIKPGHDYQSSIASALEESSAVLLLFSQYANESQEIPREVALASKHHKKVIPARTEDILPAGALAYSITNAQFVDLFRNFNSTVDSLCESLAELLQLESSSKARIEKLKRRRKIKKGFFLTASVAGVFVLAAGGWFAWKHLSTGSTSKTGPAQATMQKTPGKALSANQTVAVVSSHGSNAPTPIAKKAVHQPKSSQSMNSAAPKPTVAPRTFNGSLSPETVSKRLAKMGAIQIVEQGKTLMAELKAPLTADQAKQVSSHFMGSVKAQVVIMLAPYLENGLDADSAAPLLSGVPNSNDKVQMLKALAPRLNSNLSADAAKTLLSGLFEKSRYEGIKAIKSHLENGLPASGTATLLNGTNSFRLDALRALLPKVRDHLDGSEAASLLSGLFGRSRYDAIKLIQPQLAPKLSVSSATSLLSGTNSEREQALATLAGNLASPVSPDAAKNLLSGLFGSQRVLALKTIKNLLSQPLDANGAAEILSGTNNSRLDAIQVLLPKLGKLQNTNGILTLLSGLFGSDFVDGLRTIKSILPQGLTPSQVNKVAQHAGIDKAQARSVLLGQ